MKGKMLVIDGIRIGYKMERDLLYLLNNPDQKVRRTRSDIEPLLDHSLLQHSGFSLFRVRRGSSRAWWTLTDRGREIAVKIKVLRMMTQ